MEYFRKHSINKDILLICIIYTLAYGFLSFNMGIFWDDWSVYNVPTIGIEKQFYQNGYIPFAYFLKLAFSIFKGVLFFRILTFLIYLIISIIIYKMLMLIHIIDEKSKLIITLFFAVSPLNFSRISVVNVNHALNLFMFFAASVIILYGKDKSFFMKLLVLTLLFLSFFTPSILVFYFILMLVYLYVNKKNISHFKDFINFSVKHSIYVIWPVFFWICRGKFFKPYGPIFGDYNAINLNIPNLINTFIDTLKLSIVEPLKMSLVILANHPLLVFIIFCIVFLVFNFNKDSIVASTILQNLTLLIIGFFIFFIGAFAYMTVGKIPMMHDWHSRQQLLLPLGFAFILYYSLKLILDVLHINTTFRRIIYTMVITVLVSFNLITFYQLQLDSVKQNALMYDIKHSDIIRTNRNFLFIDKYDSLNALGRYYRFYEYTGMMKYAFGDTTRIGGSTQGYVDIELYNLVKPFEQYNVYESDFVEPQYNVIISKGEKAINYKTLFQFYYLQMFNTDKYNKLLDELIDLEFQKL